MALDFVEAPVQPAAPPPVLSPPIDVPEDAAFLQLGGGEAKPAKPAAAAPAARAAAARPPPPAGSTAFMERVQAYMREQSVSQTQLGNQIGLSQQHISRWIFGRGTAETRQALEQKIQAWLTKRGATLDHTGAPVLSGRAAAAPSPAAERAKPPAPSRKPAAPSAGSAGGSTKRKRARPPSSKGGGKRVAVRVDPPASAYTNRFAHALHKHLKAVSISQERLGKITGLRQQQISSYMFNKCSEAMHGLVEQTLRDWVAKNRVELEGFSAAQLRQPPIPWTAPHK